MGKILAAILFAGNMNVLFSNKNKKKFNIMAYHHSMEQKYYITSLVMSRFFFWQSNNFLNLNLLLLLKCIKTHIKSNILCSLGVNLIWNNYSWAANKTKCNPSSTPDLLFDFENLTLTSWAHLGNAESYLLHTSLFLGQSNMN